MNSVGSKKIKFEKYQKFTPSDYKDIGIRNFMFVARVMRCSGLRSPMDGLRGTGNLRSWSSRFFMSQ